MRIHAVLFAAIPCVLCRHNVTVDDQNPAIVYNPRSSWTLSANSSLDIGSAHMLTQDPAATATFKFTGVAVYYMSPLWPYRVNTAVSLDSGPVILLDLVDHSRPNVGQGPETVQSQVIWGSGELSNTQHTLVISVGAGQPYAIVDALVYTALDSSDITTSASASSTTSTPGSTQVVPNSSSSSATSAAAASTSTSVDASKSASIHVLPIALGTVLGVLALLLILLGIWFCIRRKRRPVSEAWTVPGTPYPGSPPVAPMMSSAPGREINGGDYVYTDVNQSYNNSWGGGPGSSVIPGAMSPAMATAYAHSYASTPPTTDQPKDDGWQGTTAQIAQRYMRSPSRYQPTTLSTITETSPQGSPLANSTGSYAGNLSNDSVGAYATPENRESLFPVLQTSSPDPQYISNRTYGL